jgi:inner membrane protein
METIDQISNRFFNSVGFKLALIIGLSLLLLIPAFLISELIREREARRDLTIQEVTSIWGNSQTLCGPVMTVQFKTPEKTGNNAFTITTKHAHFLPENLNITGSVEPEVRNRGIYKVVTYKAKLHVTGNFAPVDFTPLNIGNSLPEDMMAWIEIGIPDMRGINENINLNWNDSVIAAVPGIPKGDISKSGVHCKIPVSLHSSDRFSFDLDINGSHSLNFLPLGKITDVKLTSSWNAPSFAGAFLPDERKITEDGFTADWNVLQLNRNYPQQWLNDQYTVDESAFGVELITPVDTYQKSMRSVKYAILFIGLTFLVFFFSEMLTKIRIHPVNYLLVGVALCLFYSLLTALAEHMPFTLAYLASSLTIIALNAIFAHSLYKKWQVTATLISTLLALYVFLFVILQLTDYSLLMGNIGMVVILGMVMYFSRKIDWYSTVKSNSNELK